MKVYFSDYGGSYDIELEAETTEEAAQLALFGINRVKELRYCEAYASTKTVNASIVIPKRKKTSGLISQPK